MANKTSNKQNHSKKNIRGQQPNSRLFFLLAIVVSVVGFILYANTLKHDYTLDDFSVIKENNVVNQGTKGLATIFKTSYRHGYLSVQDGLYRPLSLAMFALEWQYSPNNPHLSHFINVVLYAFTGFLLFYFLNLLFKKENPILAFSASFLFITHPIHTEIVASIKSRDEILCFLLIICSSILLLKHIQKKSILKLIASLLCFFLALLSKETGITLLLIIPLMLYYFTSLKKSTLFSLSALYLLPCLVYFLIRSKVLGSAVGLDSVSYIDNSLLAASSQLSKMATALKVLLLYLWLLLFPNHLVCDRSFNEIPNVAFSDLDAIVALLIHCFIFYWAIRNFKKKDVLSFAILFYLITIALFSNLFITIGSVMAERFIYFSSLGFCMAIPILIDRFKPTDPTLQSPSLTLFFKKNTFFLIIVLSISFLYSFKTINRNKDWKDNYTLYSNDVKLSPNSTRMHYYLGRELVASTALKQTDENLKKQYLQQGIEELKKSIAIAPNYPDAYSQMGLGYKRLGNREQTIACYKKALELDPNAPITLNNLAAEYFEMGKYQECIEMYNKILRIDPRYVDAMMNLASCYGTVKDYNNAIVWFEKAIQIDPNRSQAHYFLSITYGFVGNKEKADYHLNIAKQLNPAIK